jgi:DNA polymerase-3 subunit beta
MKINKISRDSLLAPLASVSGIIERKHTMPILSNVLVEIKDKKLCFTGMDMELQISAFSEIAADDDEGMTVSARKFQDLLRALPEDAELSLETQGNKINVKAKRSRFHLQTLPAQDFPRLRNGEAPKMTFSLPQKTLKTALKQVEFSMALQDIRFYLNGMLLVIDGSELQLVATDGHRLAWQKIALDGSFEHSDVILPRKAVLELSKLLGDTDDLLTVSMYSNQVKFNFASTEMITKVIDGKFPDYQRVIPAGYTRQIEVSRQALLDALQRAAILSNEKVRGVHLSLSPNELKIICNNNEQEEAEEQIEVEYAGEPISIGFNITYLLDVLQRLNSEKIIFAFDKPESSALMTMPDSVDYKYVVMPMKI